MTTLAHTNTAAATTIFAGTKATRVTMGSACKAAAAVAVVGVISAFSVGLSSGTTFTPTAADLARQSELRSLLCRIDHRCPSASDLAVRDASKARTAENIVR